MGTQIILFSGPESQSDLEALLRASAGTRRRAIRSPVSAIKPT
jgi:hypothetical protein